MIKIKIEKCCICRSKVISISTKKKTHYSCKHCGTIYDAFYLSKKEQTDENDDN